MASRPESETKGRGRSAGPWWSNARRCSRSSSTPSGPWSTVHRQGHRAGAGGLRAKNLWTSPGRGRLLQPLADVGTTGGAPGRGGGNYVTPRREGLQGPGTPRAHVTPPQGDALLPLFDHRVSDLVSAKDQGPQPIARALAHRYFEAGGGPPHQPPVGGGQCPSIAGPFRRGSGGSGVGGPPGARLITSPHDLRSPRRCPEPGS